MIVYREVVGQNAKYQLEGSQKASVMLAVTDFQNQLLDLQWAGNSAGEGSVMQEVGMGLDQSSPKSAQVINNVALLVALVGGYHQIDLIISDNSIPNIAIKGVSGTWLMLNLNRFIQKARFRIVFGGRR